MTILATLLAALSASLVLGDHAPRGMGAAPGAPGVDDSPGRPRRHLLAARGQVLVLAGAATALLVAADGTTLALGLITVTATAGAARLVGMSRRRAAAVRQERRVLEMCEVLTAELRAGQPPVRALERCVEVWPDFTPVTVAARLDADVPDALRRLARSPGAGGLSAVADAWQVSSSSGASLSAALAQVAETARETQSTRRLISSELASAQATARLVALLPVVALALGSGMGGDPWRFLLTTPAGLGCLGAGLAFALTGLWWIERISDGVLKS